MKKILIMSIVGLCAINIFAASTNAFRVALAEARTNGKVAVLALLPQATNTLMLSRVYGTAVALTPKNDRPAYVASIPMSSIDATTTLTIQMLACPASSNVNAQLMAYCSSKSCRVNLWTSFKPEQATVAETVAFYEVVIKNSELTDANKDEMAKLKGELLKLKGL